MNQLVKNVCLVTAILLAAFSCADVSFAAEDYVPLAPIPGTVREGGTTNLPYYLSGLFKTAVGVAGVLAVFMVVWGGILYVTTDAITDKLEGRERIGAAIGGLILALFSYLLLAAINPRLVTLNLGFGPNVPALPEEGNRETQTLQTENPMANVERLRLSALDALRPRFGYADDPHRSEDLLTELVQKAEQDIERLKAQGSTEAAAELRQRVTIVENEIQHAIDCRQRYPQRFVRQNERSYRRCLNSGG